MNYLSHHGIKGQQWGERNGPPYPLSRQSYDATKQYVKDYKKKKAIEARQKDGYKKTKAIAIGVGAAAGVNAVSAVKNQSDVSYNRKILKSSSARKTYKLKSKMYKDSVADMKSYNERVQKAIDAGYATKSDLRTKPNASKPSMRQLRADRRAYKRSINQGQAGVVAQMALTAAGAHTAIKLANLPESDSREMYEINQRMSQYEKQYGKYKISDLENTLKRNKRKNLSRR